MRRSLKAHLPRRTSYPVFFRKWVIAARLDRDRPDWTPDRAFGGEGSYHTSISILEEKGEADDSRNKSQAGVKKPSQVAIQSSLLEFTRRWEI